MCVHVKGNHNLRELIAAHSLPILPVWMWQQWPTNKAASADKLLWNAPLVSHFTWVAPHSYWIIKYPKGRWFNSQCLEEAEDYGPGSFPLWFNSRSLDHSSLQSIGALSLSAVLEAANMSVRCRNGDHIASSVILWDKMLYCKAGSILCVVWLCFMWSERNLFSLVGKSVILQTDLAIPQVITVSLTALFQPKTGGCRLLSMFYHRQQAWHMFVNRRPGYYSQQWCNLR